MFASFPLWMIFYRTFDFAQVNISVLLIPEKGMKEGVNQIALGYFCSHFEQTLKKFFNICSTLVCDLFYV